MTKRRKGCLDEPDEGEGDDDHDHDQKLARDRDRGDVAESVARTGASD
jgi:hypothetical protein